LKGDTMTRLNTINSSKITWYIMQGDKHDDWLTSYCADGDGILQVVVYADRIELLDQLDVCNTWATDADMGAVLEAAQSYLAATYHEIYEDAMHWNDDNYADTFKHLNGIKL
jgi:hypothetical protein